MGIGTGMRDWDDDGCAECHRLASEKHRLSERYDMALKEIEKLKSGANQLDLYAFWSHDTFPYVLGSEVDKFIEGGLVKVKDFGNSAFRPIKLLPLEEGKVLAEKIKSLKTTYNQKKKELKDRHEGMLRTLMPEALK